MTKANAIAAFVKTPGLSELKTRLAAGIGKTRALEFYTLAVQATADLLRSAEESLPSLRAHWAIAEQRGLSAPFWQGQAVFFPPVCQGEGSLGMRMSHVYDTLTAKFSTVCFVGADSPHVSVKRLCSLVVSAESAKGFVLAPSEDGGFYFFGGNLPIPVAVWDSVPYSTATAACDLGKALAHIGNVQFAETDFDIDAAVDLARYRDLSLDGLLPSQQVVVKWARSLDPEGS